MATKKHRKTDKRTAEKAVRAAVALYQAGVMAYYEAFNRRLEIPSDLGGMHDSPENKAAYSIAIHEEWTMHDCFSRLSDVFIQILKTDYDLTLGEINAIEHKIADERESAQNANR